jgi:hypothetical protein
MNKGILTISIIIVGIIILFLIFSIFGILYFFWGDQKAVQDSLSTTGSIFGPIATLGAAGIAAYLFNDWRDEKEYELVKESSLSLLEATLNINSTIENFLAIVFEFLDFSSKNEFNEYCKWCDQFSRDFMQNLMIIKTENNKYHGLILDFENENKLFTFQDLEKIMVVFNKINENVDITLKNYSEKDSKTLNSIDITDYREMIIPKIQYLNKKCNPRNKNC